MKNTIFGVVAVSLFALGQLAAEPIVYSGTLDNTTNTSVQGTVVAAGAFNCGLCGHGGMETLDFWKVIIGGSGPQTFTLIGSRLDNQLDLAFVLYSGVLPEFDINDPMAQLDSSLRDGVKIWEDGSVLGLTIIPPVGDDQVDMSPTYPYGDPLVTYTLAPGTYTLGVSGGTGSGPVAATSPGDAPNYQIDLLSAGGNVVTPEPSTYVLLGTGLAGLAAAARRRKSV